MSRMTKAAAMGLVAAFLFAGCAGENPGSGKDVAVEPPSADEGQIHGFVLDDAELPVAGAEVGLLGLDTPITGKSDENGEFYLNAVRPGAYKIAAQRLGYQGESKAVEVIAGAVAEVSFKLLPVEVYKDPYYTVLIGQGYIACGAYLYLVTISNLNVCPWDTNHKPRYEFTVPRENLMGIMQEVTWQKSSALTSDKLIVYLWYKPVCQPTCTASAQYTSANAQSPIRLYGDLEDEEFEEDPVPLASMTFVGGEGVEVVVVFQQRINHYITAFYNQPGDLDTYTALPAA